MIMTTSLKLTFARYVDELGIFSIDNNPDAHVGQPLSKGEGPQTHLAL